MANQASKLWGWVKPRIQFIDIFGKNVSLTVKGEETYHSVLSISASALFLLTMLGYSITLCIQNVKDPIKSLSNRSQIDITSENQSDHAIDFFSADLNLGFGFTENLPEGVGRIKASFKHKRRLEGQ
jgi:hypothetical protein